MKRLTVVFGIISISAAGSLIAQVNRFNGSNVTGQLVLTTTVNVTQLAKVSATSASANIVSPVSELVESQLSTPMRRLHPALARNGWGGMRNPLLDNLLEPFAPSILGPSDWTAAASSAPPMQSSPAIPASAVFAFNGLTHQDQRLANGGNQLSVEPPSPNIAVGNGFVLQGVNNAIMVYNTTGTRLLAKVL